VNLNHVAFRVASNPTGRKSVAVLRPTKVPIETFEITGNKVPILYHAGQKLVENVADSFFDGWYGWGFYAAFDPNFVRRWYGPIVTRLKVRPSTKVLVASIGSASAPAGLLEAIIQNEYETNPGAKGDKKKLAELQKMILENPIHWVHAVDRLAMEKGYPLII
jgi:hypothetical protein